jgi:NOT2 / NOT3 / NOT5 family
MDFYSAPTSALANPLLYTPTCTFLTSPLGASSRKGQYHVPGPDANSSKYSLNAITSSEFNGGFDLTTLGLNLNSNTSIYKSLISPFNSITNQHMVSKNEFVLPTSFIEPSFSQSFEQTKLTTLIPTMPAETLLFAFYEIGEDLAHVLAGKELFSRGWLWHPTKKIWVKKDKELTYWDREKSEMVKFIGEASELVNKI